MTLIITIFLDANDKDSTIIIVHVLESLPRTISYAK